jgi:2-oxoglutarate ferredoxin oxidoreductase subunit beta
VARAATNTAGEVARLRRMLTRAFQVQEQGLGLSFVEILTMCPTGWFIDTEDAPDYLRDNLAEVHRIGVLKDVTQPAQA